MEDGDPLTAPSTDPPAAKLTVLNVVDASEGRDPWSEGVELPAIDYDEVNAKIDSGERDRYAPARDIAALPTEPPSVAHPMFGMPAIPAKFQEIYPYQWQAVLDLNEAFDEMSGEVRVVILDAPTGTGKTLIGDLFRRIRSNKQPTPYICTTKSLQEQIVRDFPFGKVIKGKANYRTINRPNLTTEDCDGSYEKGNDSCSWCPLMGECPYRVAKEIAAFAPLAVLNIAYYLAETQGFKSKFAGRSAVIIDEADTLESQIRSAVEVNLSPQARSLVGVKTMPKKTVVSDWVRWLENEMKPAVVVALKKARAQSSLFGRDPKELRQIRRLAKIQDDIARLLRRNDDGETTISEGWVMSGYRGKDALPKNTTLTFKPVRVKELARERLWSRGREFLLMSATPISPTQMAEELGLEPHEWRSVVVPSQFEPERRPITIRAQTTVTFKNREQSYPKITETLEQIMAEYPMVRILVHTVSYAVRAHFFYHIGSSRIVSYKEAWQRERALEEFLAKPNGVLLAPSFDRGVDLPNEDCQVIVIAKVPFPNLGDEQISERFHQKGGRTWYAVDTIRSIVQMTGRGMRHRDDWCDTYIIDGSIKRLLKDNERLFPEWWRDALIRDRNNPKYRHLVEAVDQRRKQGTGRGGDN